VRAEVWAYVDKQGPVHADPTRPDPRDPQETGGQGMKQAPASTEPTSAPDALLPPPVSNGPSVNPASLPASSSPPRLPKAPSSGLGWRSRESHHDWMLRLNAAPVVRQLDPLVNEAAQASGVDPLLLKAVIAVESSYTPDAVSPRGALGLMQIMPDTANHYATPAERQRPVTERMMEPRTNVLTGARMLADLLRRFQRIDHAMAAWNAGEVAVRKSGGLPPIGQTERHVSQVMELYWAFVRHQAASRGVRVEQGPDRRSSARAPDPGSGSRVSYLSP
jgi:soluble lytic murein transglycosylase-like protein